MFYSDALDPDGFHVEVPIIKKRRGAAGELPPDSEVLPQGAKRVRVGTPAATKVVTIPDEPIDVSHDDTPQQTQPDGTQPPKTALGEPINTKPRRILALPTSDTTTTPQQGPGGKGGSGSRLGPGTGPKQATIVPGVAGTMALGKTIADEPAPPAVSPPAQVGKNKTPSGPPADKKAGGKATTGGKAAAKAAATAPVPEVGKDIALPWWVRNYFPNYKGSPSDWRSLYPDAFQFPSSDIDEDSAYSSADTVTLTRQPGYKDYKTEFLAEQQRLTKEHTGDSPPPQPSEDFIAAQVTRIEASWNKLLEDAKQLVRIEATDKALTKARAAKAAEAKAAKDAAKEAAKAAKEAPKISAATVPATVLGKTQQAIVPQPAVRSGNPRVAGILNDRVSTAHIIASLLEHTRYQSELLERREDLLRKATLAGQRLYYFKKAAEEFREIKSEVEVYDLSPKFVAIMDYLFSMLKVRSSFSFSVKIIYC